MVPKRVLSSMRRAPLSSRRCSPSEETKLFGPVEFGCGKYFMRLLERPRMAAFGTMPFGNTLRIVGTSRICLDRVEQVRVRRVKIIFPGVHHTGCPVESRRKYVGPRLTVHLIRAAVRYVLLSEEVQGVDVAISTRKIARVGDIRPNDIASYAARALVVDKEEQSVLQNGAADSAPKLVLLEIVLGPDRGRIVEIARIEVGIPQKLKSTSMKRICSCLGGHIDLATAVIPILGVKIVCDNAEFRDGVQVRQDGCAIVLAFYHVGAVYHETVGTLPLSIDGLVPRVRAAGRLAILSVRRLI